MGFHPIFQSYFAQRVFVGVNMNVAQKEQRFVIQVMNS